MYADVTGKPRLDMREVYEYREKVNMVAGKKQKDEDLVVFAPMQLAQMRKVICHHLVSPGSRAPPHVLLLCCLSARTLLWKDGPQGITSAPNIKADVLIVLQTTEQAIEAALDDSVKALKTYVHNQISQATLVLSGSGMGNAGIGGPPGAASSVGPPPGLPAPSSGHAHQGQMGAAPPPAGLRSSPLLKPSVDLGI